MSTLYVLVLAGVALVILASVLEAAIAVSRKPDWQSSAFAPRLSLVPSAERRSTQLPYVGIDRRSAETAASPTVRAAPRKAA